MQSSTDSVTKEVKNRNIMTFRAARFDKTRKNNHPQKKKGLNIGLIAGGAIGGTVVLVVVGSVLGFLVRKHRLLNDG